MKIRRKFIKIAFGIAISFTSILALAASDMNALLSADEAPDGVVFEIVDWEDDHLGIAIPWVNAQIIALRDKYPELDIAVVSHGSEQFALLSDANQRYPKIHKSVQSLISDHDIKLELCLTHAGMRGFSQSDFPDYVDIEASGPSQIRAYEALGYERVIVELE